MNVIDYILILLIAGAVIAALFSIRKQKKNGRACTGDCAGCSHSCENKGNFLT